MAVEIERKFLLKDISFLGADVVGIPISQGYVAKGSYLVRVRRAGDQAFLTLKSSVKGLTRDEYEYEIPLADGLALLAECPADEVITKNRYVYPMGAHSLEVDVFTGRLAGLVVAEVEMTTEEDVVSLPAWVGAEVSHDPIFFNSRLAELSIEEIVDLKIKVTQAYSGAWLTF